MSRSAHPAHERGRRGLLDPEGLGPRLAPAASGPALAHEGLSICAFTIEMTQEALQATRAVYGIDAPSLVRAKDLVPAYDHPASDRTLSA